MKRKLYLLVLIGIYLITLWSCGSSSSGGGGDSRDGEKVQILTNELPTGQRGSLYHTEIAVTGGSGEFLFKAEHLPDALTINEAGVISGVINVNSSSHTISISVYDKNYENNFAQKQFRIEIVDLIPDEYENDNVFPALISDPALINKMYPGDDPQEHTLHINGDVDYVVVDLSTVTAGDEIMIETDYLTTPTDTRIQLYDLYSQLRGDNNDVEENENFYSRIFFICEFPGEYFLKIDSWNGNVGDYTLNTENTLKPIEIINDIMATATNGQFYNEQITARGGSGDYTFEAIGLPQNLFINEDTGEISGTLNAQDGSYTVTVIVRDKTYTKKTSEKEFNLDVYEPINIITETLPDAKLNTTYSAGISVSGGSGDYVYTATNLPDNLQIDQDTGVITGNVTDYTGEYTITIAVFDNGTNERREKNITLEVVEFLPDIYEDGGNDTIDTTNTITPGQTQDHNFNVGADVDYIVLDLSDITAGDVIKIATSHLSTETNTILSLYSIERNFLESDNNSGDGNFSQIFFECLTPGRYYIKLEEATQGIGDYQVIIENTGPKVTILNGALTDALRNAPYSVQINVTGGSGDYTYLSTNLPANLTMSQTGAISGTLAVDSGTYTFQITVSDNVYSGMQTEKLLQLNVVDYYPDTYEEDNNQSTAKVMRPGETQDHNFNNRTDIDYVRLDLNQVSAGNVITISTSQLTEVTNTNISLYNSDLSLIASDNSSGIGNYSFLVYHCVAPGTYYLKIESSDQRSGDYRLHVVDTGPKLTIQTTEIGDALKNSPYETQINVSGGSGDYTYTMINAPGALTMNQSGLIQGAITAEPGEYIITVRVVDNTYSGISDEKMIVLNVVHFYPDAFEIDNSFNGAKPINVGDTQERTFNIKGDKDYISLDLSDIEAGDVIKIETSQLTEETDTVLNLYNSSLSLITADNDSGTGVYSKIVHRCETPGNYFLLASEMLSDFGDYRITVTNTGQPVFIETENLSDALINAPYEGNVAATGGGGVFTFSASNLPEGMSIDTLSGVISGTPTVSDNYTIQITACDSQHPENNVTKNIEIRVVPFLPDSFEGDNSFQAAKIITLGETQEHNFNVSGDVDFIRCDLSGIIAGNVIKIETSQLTEETDTSITLYDSGFNVISNDDNSGAGNYSKIVFTSVDTLYYVKVENVTGNTGDYRINITNTGQTLNIETDSLPDADQAYVYSFNLAVTGGSGDYFFSIQSGQLPDGLTINQNTGQISGVLNRYNQLYTFTVNVSDQHHPENNSSKQFQITAFRGAKTISTEISNIALPRTKPKSILFDRITYHGQTNLVGSFVDVSEIFSVGEYVDIYEHPYGTNPGGSRGVRKIVRIEKTVMSDENNHMVQVCYTYFDEPVEFISLGETFPRPGGPFPLPPKPYVQVTLSSALTRLYVDTTFPETATRNTDRIQFHIKFPNGRSAATTLYPCYYDGETRIDLAPISISRATSDDVFIYTYDLPSAGRWRIGIAQEAEWAANPSDGSCSVTMYGSVF